MRSTDARKIIMFLAIIAVCFTALHLRAAVSSSSAAGYVGEGGQPQEGAAPPTRLLPPRSASGGARDSLSQGPALLARQGTLPRATTGVTLRSAAAVNATAPAGSLPRRSGPARLALFSIERTGSAWLVAMLNANAGVKIVSEPMLRLSGTHAPALDELDTLRAAMRIVEAEARASDPPPLRLVGFGEKFLPGRYSAASDKDALRQLQQYLVDNDFKVVLILRKNLVFQAVSMLRATRLSADPQCGARAWNRVRGAAWEEACGSAARRVWAEPVDVSELRRVLEELRSKAKAILTILSNFKIPRLTVYYEDMSKTPARTMRLITYWSGLRASDMLQPLSTPELPEGAGRERGADEAGASNATNIVNYPEIRKFLSKYNPCMLRTMEADAAGEADLTLCLV